MKIVQEALKWVGYLEKKSNAQLNDFKANAGDKNYTIFAESYKQYWGDNFQAQPWCAVFVSVVFREALGETMQKSIMPHFAYCPTGVNQFKKLSAWYTTAPKSGDVIFFKDSASVACHVGIVEKVDNTYVYTIEGNTSSESGVIANGGAVERKKYVIHYSRILGYGHPAYKEEEEIDMEEVRKLQKQIDELTSDLAVVMEHVRRLDNPMVYNYIDENMPSWAKNAVRWAVNNKIIIGTGKDENGNMLLGLTDEKIWTLQVLYNLSANGG